MLVKGGRVVHDVFVVAADGEPVAEKPVIVSLKRFLAEKEALLARGLPLGVRLETADSPETLGADVHKLRLIVLHVPHFKDGRAYSWARLLRTRLGYKGELRVTGHVLKDQITFYSRVGVDAFELPDTLSLNDVEAALTEISNVYQPSVDGRVTIPELRARSTWESHALPVPGNEVQKTDREQAPQRAAGRELRRTYDEIVETPVPPDFLALMAKIDEAKEK